MACQAEVDDDVEELTVAWRWTPESNGFPVEQVGIAGMVNSIGVGSKQGTAGRVAQDRESDTTCHSRDRRRSPWM